MLDDETQTTPDFYKMISTCRRQVRTDELQLCVSSFPTLLKHHLQHGHIPESLFDELGFDEDVDPANNVVRRDGGITKEPYQRAKTLSHEYQRRLRSELEEQAKAAAAKKESDQYEKINRIIQKNKACEERLCVVMGLSTEDVDGMMFSNATLENFEGCNVDLLKAFVHVRKFSSAIVPKNSWKWPLKKELAQVAYDHRSVAKMLELPPDVGSVTPTVDAAPIVPTVVE